MRLIDADELKKAIHEEWDEVRVWDESGAATADQFEMLVDSAPIIEERKKGKWLKLTELSNPICSICHSCPNLLFGLTSKFCPNCGADMREDI
jgi:rubrerythrin